MSLSTSRTAATFIHPPEGYTCQLAQLLKQVATGDASAFATVYDTLVPHVWAIALAVAGDRALAEAVTGQVFEDLWRSASHCPGDAEAANAWAMRVAVRSTVEAVTGGQRHLAGKARVAQRREGRVRQALLALPEQQRDALLLSCYCRLSLTEVAAVLKMTDQDAASLLCRALLRVGELVRTGTPVSDPNGE